MPFKRVLQPSFFAIGIRTNGDRLILEAFHNEREAKEKAVEYQKCLEGYDTVIVEETHT